MIKIVDRYVGLVAMQGTLLVWVGLTLIYMMIAVLGEIRGAEAYDFLEAINTGHPGSITTVLRITRRPPFTSSRPAI